jgi:thiol-disulfide isomerase/thioredoxin
MSGEARLAVLVLATTVAATAPLASQSPTRSPDTAAGIREVGTRTRTHAELLAPDFVLKLLDNGRDSLSGYRGRPVLINFWATWCDPCRAEMPLIVAAYRANQEMGLQVLAIDLTDQETTTRDVRRFVAEFSMPFPVLLDEKGKVRRLYQLRGVPTSVFVGADGVVRFVNIGPIDSETLQRGVTAILLAPSAP